MPTLDAMGVNYLLAQAVSLEWCLEGGGGADVSRTQILLTKITQICQEIRDIRGSKINNIITKLPELSQHHIRIPESSGNCGKGDPDDAYYRNNSSNHPKDQSHSPNTCPPYGQLYAPVPPSPFRPHQ